MNPAPSRRPQTTMATLAACLALQMTGYVMILPLFARRFESFGAGVSALGISAMAYALTSTLSAPVMGGFADRFGRRPTILLSITAYVLVFSGFLFAASTGIFVLLRGLAGVFTAGMIPAMSSTIGDLALPNQRARWMGILSGGASVGWIVGPVLGGMLYDQYGYFIPFAASIALELGALILAIMLIPETHRPTSLHADSITVETPSLLSLRKLPVFPLLMLISFSVMFAWAFIEPQFLFYAYDDLVWSSSQLGLVMSAYGLACMLAEFTLSQLSDRIGRKPVLVAGLALFSCQFLGLAIFRQIAWIVISFVLAGIGNALYDSALSAHILDITPSPLTARVMGLKATAGSLGNMLGPALVAFIASAIGPRVVFLISAGLVFAITFLTLSAMQVPHRNLPAAQFANAAVER
jgi:MFS family permease